MIEIHFSLIAAQTTVGGPGTLMPGIQSTVTPTAVPGEGTTMTPTAAPTTVCTTVAKWSSWVNRDKPSTGDGDKEVGPFSADYCHN